VKSEKADPPQADEHFEDKHNEVSGHYGQTLINKIKDLLKNESDGIWSNLSLTEQDEMDCSVEQLNKGQRVSIDEFLKKIM